MDSVLSVRSITKTNSGDEWGAMSEIMKNVHEMGGRPIMATFPKYYPLALASAFGEKYRVRTQISISDRNHNLVLRWSRK